MKKVLSILLIFTLLLSGCSNNSNLSMSDKEDNLEENNIYEKDFTFIVATRSEPQSFHPNRVGDDGAWPVNQNIFNRLVKLNAFNQFVPDLAKDWEFSEDQKSITFNLHDDVKWHDGEKFTSEDVKYTFDTMLEEEWYHSYNFETVESIETPDENTVVFNLTNPDSSILAKLSWYGTFIVPKHIYDGTDTATNPANQKPIGTGPFKFVEYEPGVAVRLERNDDFFGRDIDVKDLVFKIIPDDNTLIEAYKNGEVDYMGVLPVQNIDEFDNDENYNVVQILGMNRTYITFNLDDPDFKKVEVRKAIAHAIDQDSIFERAGGAGARAEYYLSPSFDQYINKEYKQPETNKEKAIELLEKAGYERDSDGYFMEKEFDYFDSDSNLHDIATIISSNLDEIGIKLVLNSQEMAAWQKKVMEDRDFSITMLAGYQGPDVSGVESRVKTGSIANVAGFSNEDMDKALNEGIKVSDLSERKKYYDLVQKICMEELPIVYLIDNGNKIPLKKEYEGYPEQDETLGSREYSGIKKLKN